MIGPQEQSSSNSLPVSRGSETTADIELLMTSGGPTPTTDLDLTPICFETTWWTHLVIAIFLLPKLGLSVLALYYFRRNPRVTAGTASTLAMYIFYTFFLLATMATVAVQ
jgi:hypothetical protein